jgi:Domain of unknown function (DUF3291)
MMVHVDTSRRTLREALCGKAARGGRKHGGTTGQHCAPADGLAVSVLSDANFAFWTCTLWSDERAMRAFMFAPAHRRLMPKLLQWCDEAAVAHWLQDSMQPPSWQEAHRRLQQEGRTSKVDCPSAAQLDFEVPPPKTSRQLKLR